MHVRFLLDWINGTRVYHKGMEFPDFADGMSDELVRRGIVEEVKSVECAALDKPVRNTMLPRAKRREVHA